MPSLLRGLVFSQIFQTRFFRNSRWHSRSTYIADSGAEVRVLLHVISHDLTRSQFVRRRTFSDLINHSQTCVDTWSLDGVHDIGLPLPQAHPRTACKTLRLPERLGPSAGSVYRQLGKFNSNATEDSPVPR